MSFEEGCLLAVNLGASGIPSRWLERLTKRELIEAYADRLAGDEANVARQAH